MSKGAMVVIGCKHPTGLNLEIGNPGEPGHVKHIVAGANQGTYRADGLLIPSTASGFGRTAIPRDFWDKWRAQNAAIAEEWQSKGFLFVADDPDKSLAQAADKASSVTGFEPLRRDSKGELADSRAKTIAPDITQNPDFTANHIAVP